MKYTIELHLLRKNKEPVYIDEESYTKSKVLHEDIFEKLLKEYNILQFINNKKTLNEELDFNDDYYNFYYVYTFKTKRIYIKYIKKLMLQIKLSKYSNWWIIEENK